MRKDSKPSLPSPAKGRSAKQGSGTLELRSAPPKGRMVRHTLLALIDMINNRWLIRVNGEIVADPAGRAPRSASRGDRGALRTLDLGTWYARPYTGAI